MIRNVAYTRVINIAFCLGLLVSTCIAQLGLIRPASAAVSGSSWRSGEIIDDPIFYNSSDMTADQVQAFLNDKVPSCDTMGTQTSEYGGGTRAQYGISRGYAPPYICLRNYYENPSTHATNLTGDSVPGGLSAAQIIKQAADTYNISVRALLSILQKESAGPLITDTWPFPSQYRNAMGYGCPDTAPCDPAYAGFYNQVNNAARQFVLYKNNPNSYRHKAMQNNAVLYNPSSSCGSGSVYIQTNATAGLYNYTPYQPNQAALNNMYGTGDSCSAYGNRNFWRIFNDWFGPTLSDDTLSPHPNGTLVSYAGTVYLIDSGSRRPVTAAVFGPYGYSWSQIKPASSGDIALSVGTPLSKIPAGTLFTVGDGTVYVATSVGGDIQKQWISAATFTSLGYNWSEIVNIANTAAAPATTIPGYYPGARHPAGALVKMNQGVYLLDETSRHYVSSIAFSTNQYSWNSLVDATAADMSLPEGAATLIRQGSILYAGGNIYVADVDANGALKRPIGPWECYATRLHFTSSDWFPTSISALPTRTGGLFTC